MLKYLFAFLFGVITNLIFRPYLEPITIIAIFFCIGFGGFLFCLWREFLLFDEYQFFYLVGYKENQFDYLNQYRKFILMFWAWDVKKFIDGQVEKTIKKDV